MQIPWRASMGEVRVRFAPAPTGELHVGGARTALYNWLFARGRGGRFILRIEDTDPERSREEWVEAILASLRWLGLDWDEGPQVGGDFGPYRQSLRLALYREKAEELKERGLAYPCYCTPAELEARRREALSRGASPGYDGRCRNLSVEERKALEREGRRPALRFRVPPGRTSFRDIIRGEVSFSHEDLEDFVILRSDGLPTYLLAAAVDDALMRITHVIRGEDLLPATPRQILLLEAMGAKPPEYAHLPLLVGPDRQPLSKRHGATSVDWYRQAGYLPEALLNYLALLGWSYDGVREEFTLEELVSLFDLERVGKNPAAFDMDKLTAFNARALRRLSDAEFARRALPFLERSGLGLEGSGMETLERAAPLVKERVSRLDQVPSLLEFLFIEAEYDEEAEKVLREAPPELLPAVLEALEGLGIWERGAIEAALRRVQQELGLTPRAAFQPIRAAVTFRTVSPPLFESVELLGRERTLKRLKTALGRR